LVEIVKALSLDARLVIMDEPTSSLTIAETARLLRVIAGLKADGVSVIFISTGSAKSSACGPRGRCSATAAWPASWIASISATPR
jgi:ribose transport system ATP-binding protein